MFRKLPPPVTQTWVYKFPPFQRLEIAVTTAITERSRKQETKTIITRYFIGDREVSAEEGIELFRQMAQRHGYLTMGSGDFRVSPT